MSAVDDVRRVRERLSADFGNDVHRLGEYVRKMAQEYHEKLGLRVVSPRIPTAIDLNKP